jgi:lipopolysaccharide assembly outer membrane protein LptD (OstA)
VNCSPSCAWCHVGPKYKWKYDKDAGTIFATGHVVVLIDGQDSKLEAESLTFDEATQILDASGGVRITRSGELTTGSQFRFLAASGEYLVTEPGANAIDPFSTRLTGQDPIRAWI